MGPERARKLAAELESQSTVDRIIVYGCAGALTKEFRPGDTLQITHVIGPDSASELKASQETLFDARLVSVSHLIRTPKEKSELQESTGAQLVDMEMAYLWKACSPRVREKLTFIRGVVDGLNADLCFLTPASQLAWTKLLHPRGARALLEFMKNLRRYRSSMESYLLHLN